MPNSSKRFRSKQSTLSSVAMIYLPFTIFSTVVSTANIHEQKIIFLIHRLCPCFTFHLYQPPPWRRSKIVHDKNGDKNQLPVRLNFGNVLFVKLSCRNQKTSSNVPANIAAVISSSLCKASVGGFPARI